MSLIINVSLIWKHTHFTTARYVGSTWYVVYSTGTVVSTSAVPGHAAQHSRNYNSTTPKTHVHYTAVHFLLWMIIYSSQDLLSRVIHSYTTPNHTPMPYTTHPGTPNLRACHEPMLVGRPGVGSNRAGRAGPSNFNMMGRSPANRYLMGRGPGRPTNFSEHGPWSGPSHHFSRFSARPGPWHWQRSLWDTGSIRTGPPFPWAGPWIWQAGPRAGRFVVPY